MSDEASPERVAASGGAPPVVAVVVTRSPGDWFEELLASLAAQDYPNLSVLIVNRATDPTLTARVAAVLPGAFVRDVVAAYRRVTVDGRPGAVYNVCSGRSVAIEDIARQLLALSDAGLELEVDTDLFRPVDVPEVRGDPSLIRETTGWEPVVPLDQTLRDTLEYWRRELA